MNARTLVVASALGLTLIIGGSPAAKADLNECLTKLDTLITSTTGVAWGGRHAQRTEDSLVSKLMGAKDKLSDLKVNKACTKAQQYEQKVDDLDAQGKAGDADVDDLIDQIQEIENCIDDLTGTVDDCEAVTP